MGLDVSIVRNQEFFKIISVYVLMTIFITGKRWSAVQIMNFVKMNHIIGVGLNLNVWLVKNLEPSTLKLKHVFVHKTMVSILKFRNA